MTVTAADWDARIHRLSAKLPARGRAAVDWLSEPSRVWVRAIAGVLLVLGGIFSILPILGIWMLPLGLALIAQDVPGLKVPMERAARWMEKRWEQLKLRFGSSRQR